MMVSVSPVRYPLPVRVAVTLMRSGLADEIKTIASEGGDEFSGSERPEATVIDGHVLDGDRDAGLLLGNLHHFDGILWTFRQWLSLLDELLDDHANDFIDVAQRFFSGAPRGCCADALESRAVGVPCRIALDVLVALHYYLEVVGFHRY